MRLCFNFEHKNPNINKLKTLITFKNFTVLNSTLYFDTFQYSLEKLLGLLDRNSMSFSKEVRRPYLSHELVEFIFSLPSKYKMNEGLSKKIL